MAVVAMAIVQLAFWVLFTLASYLSSFSRQCPPRDRDALVARYAGRLKGGVGSSGASERGAAAMEGVRNLTARQVVAGCTRNQGFVQETFGAGTQADAMRSRSHGVRPTHNLSLIHI